MLKKKWGQHLLIAKGIIKKLVENMEIKEGDVIVEIGAGTGNLTEEILNTPFKKLYLLEIDPEMVKILKKKFKNPKIIILETDAAKFDFSSLKEDNLKVVGNLPYNIASLIIENTIFYNNYIPYAFFMVQKEVAERLTSRESWLGIFLQTFYQIFYLMSIPARFFYPPPKVQSAFLKLKRKENPNINDLKHYKNFLLKIFQQKRKMLKQKLPIELLIKAQVSFTKRVEELSLEEILKLYQIFKTYNTYN